MSVTVLLVLGDRASQLVDELSMEHWFSSYIGRPPQNTTRFNTRLFPGDPLCATLNCKLCCLCVRFAESAAAVVCSRGDH